MAARRGLGLLVLASVLLATAPPAAAGSRIVRPSRALDRDADRIVDRFLRGAKLDAARGATEDLVAIACFDHAPTAADEALVESYGGVVLARWDELLYALHVALPPEAVTLYAEDAEGLTFLDADHGGHKTTMTTTRQLGIRDVWAGTGRLDPYKGKAHRRIAILDSGLDATHTDLRYVSGGWVDYVGTDINTAGDESATPIDPLGHGTLVAGIAAGIGTNAGYAGPVGISLPGFFPTPEGTVRTEYFPVKIGATARSLIATLVWSTPTSQGRHSVSLLNQAGTSLGSTNGIARPLALSVPGIANADQEAYRAAFATVTGDGYDTSGNFYWAQVQTYFDALDAERLLAGASPESSVVAARIVDRSGRTSVSAITNGLTWVLNNRATYQIVVVNLSVTLDNSAVNTALDTAVDNLVDAGVAVVVAAGNAQQTTRFIGSPATASKALTVGAVNHLDQLAFYSSLGEPSRFPAKPDLLAPGGTDGVRGAAGTRKIVGADSNTNDAAQNASNVWSVNADNWSNDYTASYGTSLSAAIVAGAVALIADARGGWGWGGPADPRLAKMLLTMTSHEIQTGETSQTGLVVEQPGPPGRALSPIDRTEGYGRVNVQAAIEALTLPFAPGADSTFTLSNAAFGRRVWARRVALVSGQRLTATATLAAGLDADVYLYRGTPNSDGTPAILASSTAASGTSETLQYTPASDQTAYLVVKWVSGSGSVTVAAPYVETCDGVDNDADGTTDEALTRSCFDGGPGELGVGTCRGGTSTCAAGLWGACTGQVLPNGPRPFRGEYYTGMNFDTLQGPQDVDSLQFQNDGDGFGPGQGTQFYSSVWDGQVCAPTAGSYSLRVQATCRFSLTLTLNGVPTLVVPDDGNCQSAVETVEATVALPAGCTALRATHRHATGLATMKLDLRPPAGQYLPLTGVWTQGRAPLCDGLDDNCDGRTDEQFADKGRPCDGDDSDQCRNGTWTCSADKLGLACLNESPRDLLEDCNALDDDCDGLTDESVEGGILKRSCWEGPPTLQATGQCRTGEQSCVDNHWADTCVGQVRPTGHAGYHATFYGDVDLTTKVAEGPADAVDFTANSTGYHPNQPADGFATRFDADFCVGVAGEYTFYLTSDDGQRLYFDEGEGPYLLVNDWVEHAPTTRTSSIQLVPGCYPIRYETFDAAFGAVAKVEFSGPSLPRQLLEGPYVWTREETACNYRDEDCDGASDEDWALEEICDGSDTDMCKNGRTICAPDGSVEVCGPEMPTNITEKCNAVDDDCDGTTDEDYPLGERCAVGVGACEREGVYVCDTAHVGYVCNATAGAPTAEVCDAVDNDCDASTDEDAAGAALTRHCYNGPFGSEDVGLCRGGTATCEDGAYGLCMGEIVPTGYSGFHVTWYATVDLSGAPALSGDAASIDLTLAEGEAPLPGLPSDNISARWTTRLCVPATGDYTFFATSDDGQRLLLDLGEGPTTLIDEWQDQGATESSHTRRLSAGCYPLTYEWYEAGGGARALVEIEATALGVVRQTIAAPFAWRPLEGLCDGKDDDCDGQADEQWDVGVACDGPDTDFCENGALECTADGSTTVCGTEDLIDITETCDGADEDCDGATDEDEAGAALVRSCYSGEAGTLGTGICAEGTSTCTDGAFAACVGDLTPHGGFRATYFGDVSLQGRLGEAVVPNVDFDLAVGEGFTPALLGTNVSARFETDVCVVTAAPYTLHATSTDGQRLWVNVGEAWLLVLDDWAPGGDETRTVVLSLLPGCTPLRYEVFKGSGPATVRLAISGPTSEPELLDGDWTTRAEELCNGLDDDCDGVTDESETEGLPLAEACYFGPAPVLGQGTCAEGTRECADGAWGECSSVEPPMMAAGVREQLFASAEPTGDAIRDWMVPFPLRETDGTTAPVEELPPDGPYALRWDGLLCLEGPVSSGIAYLTASGPQRFWLDVDGTGFDAPVVDEWDGAALRTTELPLALGEGCHAFRYEAAHTGGPFTAKIEIMAVELGLARQLLSYPHVWQLAEGLCDGADDDCDGTPDDEWLAVIGTICDGDDSDECANGAYVCAVDGEGVACGPEDPADIPERCNAADDDCDGDTDEDFTTLGMPCDGADADRCATGEYVCAVGGGGVACHETGSTGIPEVCDAQDNDCDGLTDEDFGDLRQPCDGPDSDECENGQYVCAVNGEGVVCGDEDPADIAEECNLADDDCDGQTDEGLGLTVCGEGECLHTVANCQDGETITCDPFEGAALEICDGRDNDCDASVDEEDPAPLCDDGNGCTDDACGGFDGCVALANTAPCDDDDACTTADQCAASVCVGGPALACDDGNPCTDNSCIPASGCDYPNNTAACDDGNACTADDVCESALCRPGAVRDCDDTNPCTDDACDPETGCTHAANTAACDDGDACTEGDLCAEGVCTAGPDEVECDDENPCTDESCDPVHGCQFVNNALACDDADACTEGEACAEGACAGGLATDCDDDDPCTDDACDPASGCTHAANSGATCDDGDACTEGEVCAEGACGAGQAKDCDDDDPCTTDACAAGECTHTADIEGCCQTDADCPGEKDFCLTAEHRCVPDWCSPCEDDDGCGGPNDLCVEMASGKHCGVACVGPTELCPEGTVCTDVEGRDTRQCLPIAGDCECVPDAREGCHDGAIVSFDSCGAAGAVVDDCGGRGCAADACCPVGTSQEGDECVTASAETPDKPDALEPDAGGEEDTGTITPDGTPTTDTTTGGDTGGGGGGGGGGGCTTGAPAGAPLGALVLLLALVLGLARRRARG